LTVNWYNKTSNGEIHHETYNEKPQKPYAAAKDREEAGPGSQAGEKAATEGDGDGKSVTAAA
jgi:hypothetical protein